MQNGKPGHQRETVSKPSRLLTQTSAPLEQAKPKPTLIRNSQGREARAITPVSSPGSPTAELGGNVGRTAPSFPLAQTSLPHEQATQTEHSTQEEENKRERRAAAQEPDNRGLGILAVPASSRFNNKEEEPLPVLSGSARSFPGQAVY